jgi:hypothetical protein
VDNWNNITNSQNRVMKKSFGGTFCFSNCHIIRLDTGRDIRMSLWSQNEEISTTA